VAAWNIRTLRQRAIELESQKVEGGTREAPGSGLTTGSALTERAGTCVQWISNLSLDISVVDSVLIVDTDAA
jgi:hypothetical protein